MLKLSTIACAITSYAALAGTCRCHTRADAPTDLLPPLARLTAADLRRVVDSKQAAQRKNTTDAYNTHIKKFHELHCWPVP